VFDFLGRVRPEEDEAAALIHAGALDELQPGAASNRGLLLWLLACWRKSGQKAATLFPLDPTPPPLPPEDQRQRLRNEYRVLGFLCGLHPVTLFARQRSRAGALTARELLHLPAPAIGQRRRVRFLGWLITGKIVGTKKGDPMEFLSFEDETGLVECTLFPKVYEQYCHLLSARGPLLLEGYLDEDFGARTLTVEHAAGPQSDFSPPHREAVVTFPALTLSAP
jgi:DNA polymerase III alpha subunit